VLDGNRYQVPEPNVAPQSNTAIWVEGEIKTRWEEFARREISVNPPWLSSMGKEEAVERFERRVGAASKSATGLLADDGLPVTYYNNTSVDARASLIRAS